MFKIVHINRHTRKNLLLLFGCIYVCAGGSFLSSFHLLLRRCPFFFFFHLFILIKFAIYTSISILNYVFRIIVDLRRKNPVRVAPIVILFVVWFGQTRRFIWAYIEMLHFNGFILYCIYRLYIWVSELIIVHVTLTKAW